MRHYILDGVRGGQFLFFLSFFQASSCARFCMWLALHYFFFFHVLFLGQEFVLLVTCTQPSIKKYNCPSLVTRCSSPWEFLSLIDESYTIFTVWTLNIFLSVTESNIVSQYWIPTSWSASMYPWSSSHIQPCTKTSSASY